MKIRQMSFIKFDSILSAPISYFHTLKYHMGVVSPFLLSVNKKTTRSAVKTS